MVDADQLPEERRRLWRRYSYEAREALSKPLLSIFGTFLGGFVGLLVAGVGSAPVVRDGTHLVAAQPPLFPLTVGLFAGSVSGVTQVVGGAFSWSWLRYRYGGDAIWTVKGGIVDKGWFGGPAIAFELVSKDGVIRHNARLLGQLVCLIRTPRDDGPITHHGVEYEEAPLGSATVQVETMHLPGPGVYEVIWIRAREGETYAEKARGKVTLVSDDAGRLAVR